MSDPFQYGTQRDAREKGPTSMLSCVITFIALMRALQETRTRYPGAKEGRIAVRVIQDTKSREVQLHKVHVR